LAEERACPFQTLRVRLVFPLAMAETPLTDKKKKRKVSKGEGGQDEDPVVASFGQLSGGKRKAIEAEELPELLAAAERGDAAAVAAALTAGGDVNATSRGGYSALNLAALGGHADAIVALLEAKAPATARTAFGQSALQQAARAPLGARCVELLLEAKAELHGADSCSGGNVAPGLTAHQAAIRGGALAAALDVLSKAYKESPAPKVKAARALPGDVDAIWALLHQRSSAPQKQPAGVKESPAPKAPKALKEKKK